MLPFAATREIAATRAATATQRSMPGEAVDARAARPTRRSLPRRVRVFAARRTITRRSPTGKVDRPRCLRVRYRAMAEAYDFRNVEPKWRERWEIDATYRARSDGRPKYYVLEMLPYPSGDLHVGHAKNYSFGDAIARMMRMMRLRRAASDGLRRVRPARRERGDRSRRRPGDVDGRKHRSTCGARFRLMGTGYDWSREIATLRARVLSLESVALLAPLRARACVQARSAGQLVSARQDRARQRASHRRTLLALRTFGRTAQPVAVVLEDHRLRGSPARRSRQARRMAGAHAHDAAQLDRPQRRRAVRFAASKASTKRSTFSRRAPTRCSARRSWRSRPSIRSSSASEDRSFRSRTPAQIDAFAASSRIEVRARTHESDGEARALHRRVRDQSALARARADLGDELRAGRVRHRRGDGRSGARRARLRVRKQARAAGRAGDRAATASSPTRRSTQAFVDDGRLIASGDFNGMSSERARGAIATDLVALRRRREDRQRRACATGWFRASAIGARRFRSCTATTCGEVPVPDDAAAGAASAGVRRSTGEGSPLAQHASRSSKRPARIAADRRGARRDTMDTFFESSWYYLRYLDPHDADAAVASRASRRTG